VNLENLIQDVLLRYIRKAKNPDHAPGHPVPVYDEAELRERLNIQGFHELDINMIMTNIRSSIHPFDIDGLVDWIKHMNPYDYQPSSDEAYEWTVNIIHAILDIITTMRKE